MVDSMAAARWRSPDDVWLDHATLTEADAEWLAPARTMTLWSVQLPDGLLASLPNLELLDLQGGTGATVSVVQGCRHLRYLGVNQVRGVADLAAVATLTSLELLSLYGLPRMRAVPSLRPLSRLRRVELGSLKGLSGLTGVHDAPALEELVFIRAVGVAPDDAARLAAHPTLSRFNWFAEDVPTRIWAPFGEEVGKEKARLLSPAGWFDSRAGD